MSTPKPKPKARTIRAYAVVCKDGELARHGRVEFTEADGEEWRAYHDRRGRGYPGFTCGPHRVVALRGVWKEKVKRG